MAPTASVTVTVTGAAATFFCGVPEMSPVAASIFSPAGSPVATYVSGGAAPVSVALTCTLTGIPSQDCSVAGMVTVTRPVMVQLMTALPTAPVPSVAVTVTGKIPAGPVGVPVMTPVPAAILSPAGRPAAPNVMVWPVAESVAVTFTAVIAVPTADFSAAGAVTVTTLAMVQVKPTVAATVSASVTVTVTG